MTLARAHNRDTVPLRLYTKLERRNPCSKPPTVYVDLSTRNDWTVKITTVVLPMEIRNAFSIIRRDLWSRYLFYDLLKLKPSKKREKTRIRACIAYLQQYFRLAIPAFFILQRREYYKML